MSSEPFDPYYKWLGIPPKDQPADHYRLLGINRYETDQDVIVNAADRVMAHIRSMGPGRYSDQSQKILNEISRGKLVLLNAEKKSAYDAELRAKDVVVAPPAPPAGSAIQRAVAVRPQAVPPAPGSSVLRSVPGAPAAAPVPVAPPVADDDSGSYDNVMVDADPPERASTSSIGRRKPAASGNAVLYAAIAGGVVAVGGLGYLVMGGSGESPRTVAQTDKDKSTKEDKSSKGKSTASPATTDQAPAASTATVPPAASTSGPPPFGATAEVPRPASTVRPSGGGGNWPTLPFDPSAVRPAVDREKLVGLRRQAGDLERNRDYSGAVALLDQHEDAVQSDSTLCQIRSRAFINLKQYDRAEKDLRRRSELESENPLAVHEVVTLQLTQGNREDARKTFAAAFEKFQSSEHPPTLIRLGYMAVGMSDPGMPWPKIAAVTQKAYDRIRNDNPTNGLSWFVTRGHGAVLVRKAAAEKNAELARTAMPMFRGSVMAWDMLFLGLAHHTTGSKSASDDQLRQAAEWQRSYSAGRNWQEQLDLAIIQRDLAENFGLRMDAAGTPPVGIVGTPGGPTPSIPGTPGTPGTPLPGGLGSLVPPGGATPGPGVPLPAQSKKKDVPDAETLKTAQESVKTLFKDEYAAAKKPEQKVELARRIKAKADQMGDDANVQYAAYEEALDLALAANESALGWAIVESIGDAFEVPLPKLQFEVLQKANTQVKTPVQAKAWCDLAEQTLQLAIQLDDLDTGSKLGKMSAARAKMVDPATHKRFVDLSADIEDIKKGFATVGAALETLKSSPDDPVANAQVGRYRCFHKKDWEGGLPHLAKGDDGALKIAAAKELTRQTSPKELVALADLWFGAAQERTNPKEKQALMAHANGYYQLALPSLEGFERATVSKKLEDYIAPLWNRIRLAMKNRKLTTTTLAGTNQFGAAQMELPTDPRLLTGLRFTCFGYSGGINGRYSVVTKITPTYFTPTGSVEGNDEGYTEFRVTAKPGYVIGSIAVNCSNEYVHGLQVTFVALDGDKLNARDSYTSPFYGSRTGGTVTLGSNSQPIVSLGQFGSTSYLRGMQLLLAP